MTYAQVLSPLLAKSRILSTLFFSDKVTTHAFSTSQPYSLRQSRFLSIDSQYRLANLFKQKKILKLVI
ncbi:unnamed protein product [Adineta ricciae]|uniref:Uncharacterized protein n=1 Tax=Adineta ricciae TaxID=249248 RepID=A0A815H319_ADIRI|nr:unnamed protein product [Adineta ricciae]